MIWTLLTLFAVSPQEAPAVQAQPAQPQAVTATCSMTAEGYVCRFPSLPASASPASTPPLVTASTVGSSTLSTTPVRTPEEIAEAQRQERLINRCADAPWYALCLPEDRREARRLRDAAVVRAALRGEVTRLLSEQKCDDAVRVALTGGDMVLAREVRDFCTPTVTQP